MTKAFSLPDQRILITGASSGIGRATAQLCAEAGAQVFLLARNQARLEKTMQALPGNGHQLASLDITDSLALQEVLAFRQKEWGGFDGLVHAAGITQTKPFKYLKEEDLEELFSLNVKAPLNLTRFCLKKTPKTGMSVVFISSVMASVGEVAKTGYSASKGALLAAARSMALEMAPKKVRVNCISPGVVNTPMTENATYRQNEQAYQAIMEKHPLGLGEPEDVAQAVLYLLSPASRWVTGTNLVIDGGYTAR